MSWFTILIKEEEEKDWKKRAKEKAEKIKKLNAQIRSAHTRLSRQISIDPKLESVESRKLIRLLEILAEKQDELHEE